MPGFPFEVSTRELRGNIDHYVDTVFSCLASEFLVMPKGDGFVEYPVFERGYEALKGVTGGFTELRPGEVLRVVLDEPIAFVVLRVMLGFTPPEWAYVTTQHTGTTVPQNAARNLDRKARLEPGVPIAATGVTGERIEAMVRTACHLLSSPPPAVPEDRLHRLDKADTKAGLAGIRHLARMGVPYAMLLYERFLGRPFAGHRDSVSERIGDRLETAIEEVLFDAGVSFRKTRRAEKIEGFDQAPDFIVPSEFSPAVVIEAKITEDDGTARDKVTRILHLVELSRNRSRRGLPGFQVVACIGGRGFGVRREDMRRLLLETGGKVFTLKTLDRLVPCTQIRRFACRRPRCS